MAKKYRGGGGGWKTVGMKTTAKASSSYSAPTTGLQKVLFSFGLTNDASEFTTTKSKLAWHVGIQPWAGAPVASMAMEDMTEPIMTPPTRPTLDKLVTKSDGATSTITRGEDDSEYKMKVGDYLAGMRTHRTKKDKWDENRPRTYDLVLQHCPPELETRLTSQANWDQV